MKIEKFYNKKEGKEQFRARFQINRKEFTPTADTRKRLGEIVDEIRASQHREKYELPTIKADVTLARLVAEAVRSLDLTLKNHRRRKVVLEDFAAAFPEGYTLRELDTVDIKTYVERRRKESKLKPWSVHSLLTIISSALNSAPQTIKELADYRPPRIPWVKLPTDGAGRVITPEEREKLLAALRAPRGLIEATMKSGTKADRLEQWRDVFTRHELADMFEIALNTGMRWGEIVRLEWRFVDLKNDAVTLPKEITKTNRARVVYLNERAREILDTRRAKAATVWVFPNAEGTSYRKYYSKPLRTVARRIGLEYGRDLDGGFTPHSTRHTAGTMLVRLTDIKTAGEILGHSSSKMTLIYAHTDEKEKRAAAKKMGRILQGKKS